MKALWRIGMAAGAGLAGTALIARAWTRSGRRELPDPIHELAATLTRYGLIPDILAAIEHSFTSALGFPSAIFMLEGNRLCVSHHSSLFQPDDGDMANARLSISSGSPVAHVT